MIARNPNRYGLFFQRDTIIAAAHALKVLGHHGFDRVMLDLGLEVTADHPALAGRANALAEFVIKHPDALIPRGTRLDVALVSRASHLLESSVPVRERVLRIEPSLMSRLATDGVLISGTHDLDSQLDEHGNFGASDSAVNLYEPYKILPAEYLPDSMQDGG
jgi:hypothetical protein